MKLKFGLSILACATTLMIGCTALTKPDMVKKPNVLIILIDDLGWADVATYNPKTNYSTPNMDKLAAEGLKFTDGYAASPICSPTRAALITGLHPTRMGTTDFFRNRLKNNKIREGRFKPAPFNENLPEQHDTIANVLKNEGYDTAFLGKWHLGQTEQEWPEYYGFDVNVGGHVAGSPMGGYFSPYTNPRLESGPKGEYLTDRLTSEAISLLGNYAQTDKPFFMLMSYYSVHTKLAAPQNLIEKYKDKFSGTDPKTEFAEIEQIWPNKKARLNRVSQTHPTYASMVEKVDENIGRIVNELDKQNLQDDTIVILLSDNGGLSTSEGSPTSNLPLNGGKGWLYEGGIRVPFVIRVPGSASNGQTSDVPVTMMDISATIYSMLDIDKEKLPKSDGESLKSILAMEDGFKNRPLFFHYPHYSNQGGFPGAAVRLGKWKLLERFEDGQVQLFNLANDLGEKHDLASNNPDKVDELRTILHQWYKDQNAEFLRSNPNKPQFGEPWKPDNKHVIGS